MSHTPYRWVNGEIITAEKLNDIEDDVAYAISKSGQTSVLMGSGAPTSGTQAEVGQLYADVSNGYSLYICIGKSSGGETTWYYGPSGYSTALVYLYKRSQTAPSIDWTSSLTYNFTNKTLTSVPYGWSANIPSGTDPLYVTTATAYSNMPTDTIEYTDWSQPVILARDGAAGAPGTNGTNGLNAAMVFLYKRPMSAILKSDLEQGQWSLNSKAPTINYSVRCRTKNFIEVSPGTVIHYTNVNYDSYFQVYPDKDTSTFAQEIGWISGAGSGTINITVNGFMTFVTRNSADWSTEIVPEDWDGEVTITYGQAVVPDKPTSDLTYDFTTGTLSGSLDGWSQTIQASNGCPCYVIQAKAAGRNETYTITRSDWSDPVVLVENGENGTPGSSGYNNAIIYLYQRSASKPSVAYVGDITYTFANDTISFEPSGWKRNIDAVSSGTDPIWVTAASASSTGPSDTIASNEWSDPIVMARDGTSGSSGYNNAILYLYRRSSTKPSVSYSGNITYTFATNAMSIVPAGWYRDLGSVPASSNPIYVTAASASSTGPTDTIASNEWSDPIILAQDGANGTNGTNGTNGLNSATVFLYQRADSTPQKPSAAVTYTFSSGEVEGMTNGWLKNIPTSHGSPCYVIQATASSTGTTDTIGTGEWSNPVILVENGANGLQGPPGYNHAVIYLYRRSATKPSVSYSGNLTYTFATDTLSSVPSGWYRDLGAVPSSANPMYVTVVTASSNAATDTIASTDWSDPIILSKDGTDGMNIATVCLYQRATSTPTKPSTTVTYTFSNGKISGYSSSITSSDLESGVWNWSDKVDRPNNDRARIKELVYVTAGSSIAYTVTNYDVYFGVLATPYSKAYIQSPGWKTTSGTISITQNGYLTFNIKNHNDDTLTVDPSAWDGTVTITHVGGVESWSQVPPEADGRPCYLTLATASSNTATDTISSSEWSSPSMYSDAGNNGYNNAVIYLYRRSSTTPTVSYIGDLTYTFSTDTLSSEPSGWKRNLNDISGTDPLWVSTASASSTSDTDTIASGEWSSPVKLAQNGTNGLNVATVFLYQRAASAPSKPSSDITYTFSNGSVSGLTNNWVKDIPTSNPYKHPCYVIQATASSTAATDTIGTGEWSSPAVLVEDGSDGDPGLSSASVFLYMRQKASITNTDLVQGQWTYTKPEPSINYSTRCRTKDFIKVVPGTVINYTNVSYDSYFNVYPDTDPSTTVPSQSINWNTGAGSGTINITVDGYMTFVTRKTNATTTEFTPADWDGSVTIRYPQAVMPSKPSADLTYTFVTGVLSGDLGWWAQTIPDSNGYPCYSIQATAVSSSATDTIASSEWSSPVIMADNGDTGYSTAIVYLYKRSSTAISAIDWSTTLTYNFANKALTSTPSGWYQSVPSGTNPLYVTAATAYSNTGTDTIQASEWSTPSVLAQNGTNGSPGLNSATAFLYIRQKASITNADLVQGQWTWKQPDTPSSSTYLTRCRSKDLIYVNAGTVVTYQNVTYDSYFNIYATNDINNTDRPSQSGLGWNPNINSQTKSGTFIVTANGWMTFIIRKTGATTTQISPSDWDGTVSIVPAKPSSDLTYTFATGVLSGSLNGWSQTVPAANGFPCYIIQATAVSSSTTDTITASEWSDQKVLVEDGVNGVDGVDGVGVSSIVPEYYLSTSSDTPTGDSWSTTAPTWTTGKFIFTRSHIFWDDGTESYTDPQLDNAINDLGSKYADINTKVGSLTINVTNGSTSSTIKLKAGSTELSSQTIQMSGLVKFSDLSTSGSTTINGANITTGTISAERIDTSTLRVREVYLLDDGNYYSILTGNIIAGNPPTTHTHIGPKDIDPVRQSGSLTITYLQYTNIYGTAFAFGYGGRNLRSDSNSIFIDISAEYDGPSGGISKTIWPKANGAWDIGTTGHAFRSVYSGEYYFSSGGRLETDSSGSTLYFVTSGGSRRTII